MSDKSTFNTDTVKNTFTAGAFLNDDTRISQDALKSSTEYLRVFTREAIYRAQEKQNQSQSSQLEERHLQDIAGVLLLDF